MKPVKLRMKNFGPFTDETVDFTKPAPMFLITGKTGSGKSMIFDAMTYALYGKYSGNRQNLKKEALRSDFADASEKSLVEFTFSVHDKNANGKESLYKVTRTLPAEYVNRNGKTSTKQSETELEKFDSASGKFIPLPFKTSEDRTKEIAENIIQLPFNEFNQIVLLPQGKFAEFLTETSKDRESTLKKIFPIGDIEKVVEKLKEKTKEYSAKIKEITDRIEDLTKGGENEDSFKQKIEKFDIEIKKLEEERNIAGAKASTLTEKKAKAVSALETAKKNEETAKEIRALEEERAEIEGLEEKTAKAKKAAAFKIEIERCDSAKKRLEKADTEKEAAEKKLEQAEAWLSELSKKSGEMAELSKKNESDTNEIRILKENIEKIVALQKAKNEKARIEGEIDEFKKSTRENDEKIPKLEAELSSLAAEHGIAESDGGAIATALLEKCHEKATEKEKAESLISLLKKIEDKKAELSKIESEFEKAREQAEGSQKIVGSLKITIERLEDEQKKYEDNQKAAFLAHDLKPGCACPVCGSTEHPQLAVKKGESLETEIAVQKAALAEKEKLLESDKERFQKLKGDKEHQEKTIADFEASLESGMSLSEAEKTFSDANASEAKAKANYERAKKLSSDLNEANKKKEDSKDKLNELNTRLEKSLTAIEEQERGMSVGKDEDAKSIESRVKEMEAELESNKQILEKFEKAMSNATSDVKTSKALEEAKIASKKEAENDLQEARKKLDEKIEKSDFKDEDEIKSQLLSEIEISTAEERINSWKRELESQKKLFESTKSDKKIEDIEEEIEKASEEFDAAKKAETEANEKINELSKEKALTKRDLDELVEKNEEHRELLEKSGIYTALYRDMNGETGNKEVFSSWVLATHFSEVVDYANERFLELSGGRYQFKIQKTKEVGKHGLDIAINDSENGDRAPETLSGGETFQASISLALAMTDVICQRTGGIRLDSLFIDEGFGSLDQESLDKAIATLKKIQEQKMVGVISHVEAMETEIKSHVVVDKGPDDCHSSVRIENFE